MAPGEVADSVYHKGHLMLIDVKPNYNLSNMDILLNEDEAGTIYAALKQAAKDINQWLAGTTEPNEIQSMEHELHVIRSIIDRMEAMWD